MLPFENIAIMINNEKITSKIAPTICFELGKEEAWKFYTKAIRWVRGSNKGGLGWSNEAFNKVDWKAINCALRGRPNGFQLWLPKQVIGVCAMQKNTAQIQDILDDQCPNCRRHGEDNQHLNRCHNAGQVWLFRDSVRQLKMWMHKQHQTDSELAFWINEFLLHRGQVQMTNLVMIQKMSGAMYKVAQSQDRIRWVEFLHGKVSTTIRQIQQAHCSITNTRINGGNWMTQFVGRLMDISHSQWLYRNFTLHHRKKGYLRQQTTDLIQQEVDQLSKVSNLDILPESCYLLELPARPSEDSTATHDASWVLAMRAAQQSALWDEWQFNPLGRRAWCF
jgi:hypothetical protein